VGADLDWFTKGVPLAAGVLELADDLFFLVSTLITGCPSA
jgi:hypothetical protein